MTLADPYLLFVSHSPQLAWYALFAGEMRRRRGLRAVLWALGDKDAAAGRATGEYDEVVDLLAGFDPRVPSANAGASLSAAEAEWGGAEIHKAVISDRYIASRRWPRARVRAYAAHVERVIREELARRGSPEAAFGETNSLAYRIAHLALRDRCPHWNFSVARHWPDRFYLDHGQTEAWPEVRATYERFVKEGVPEDLARRARQRLDELRSGTIQPLDTQRFRAASRRIFPADVGRRLRERARDVAWDVRTRESTRNPRAPSLGDLLPLTKVRQSIVSQWRRRAFYRRASTRLPTAPFVSYFLHMEPEHSLDGPAFEFKDQLVTIENVAAVLPADHLLVVKEHYPMVGMRPASYYRELEALPNVVLLSDQASPHEIIRRSRAVFTLSGTCALEAAYFGVPAVVFGNLYFEAFRGIHKVDSMRDLRRATARALSAPGAGASTEDAVMLLAATFAASRPGKVGATYSLAEMREPANLARIADAIEEGLDGIREPLPEAI